MNKIDRNSLAIGVAIGQSYGGGGHSGGKLSEITVRSQPTTFEERPAAGYYGIGKVTVEGDENLIPDNIKYGTSILGIEGSYAPKDPKLMVGSATLTENGIHNIYPSGGYDGLSRVRVTVDVPEAVVLQSKSVTPGYSTITVVPDDDYNGLSSVVVSGDPDLVAGNIRDGVSIFGVKGTYVKTEVIDAVLQSKNVTPGRNSQVVYPDNGYNGFSSVYVVGDGNLISSNIREGVAIFGVQGSYSSGQVYQEKTVTPGKNSFSVIADSDYNALSQVIVRGDSNLVPSKIAAGSTIFGVTGTYVSPMKPITVIPSIDEQLIVPANGFAGFSSVTVAPVGTLGDYGEGFAAGAASRDAEMIALQEQIKALQDERDAAYENGYAAGYEVGAMDTAASYNDLDEVSF